MNTPSKLPPILYSILGFGVLLAWLLIGQLTLLQAFNESNNLIPLQSIISTLTKNLLYWKPFSFVFFVTGIYLHSILKNRIKSNLFQTKIIATFIGAVVALMVVYSLLSGQTIAERPFILHDLNSISNSIIIPSLYGFIILLLGIWAGENKWLYEYHFLFHELKHIFMYSLVLYIAWFLLKIFNVYSIISGGILAQIIYMIDTLTINLVVVFIYLFLLISLENFKLGKKVLKLLFYMGRFWFISALVLFAILLLLK